MKFLYVDVIETNVVSIFKTETGEILKLSAKDVTEQKKKHALLGSYEAHVEFDDALSAMGQYKQAKPWWKFW